MDKSEFYKLWYTRLEGSALNEHGFPTVLWLAQPITTEEQWTEFLTLELEVEELAKINPEACSILDRPFVPPHATIRQYPNPLDQLDGIYKALLAIRESGIELGNEANEYLDSITAVKTAVPKTHSSVPTPPDPTLGIETEVLPEEELPEFPPDYEPPV